MKSTFTTVIALLVFACSVSAQEAVPKSKRNSTVQLSSSDKTYSQQVYVSLWGPTAFAGLNYDIRFTGKETGLGARVGLGVVPQYNEYRTDINGVKKQTEYRPTMISVPFGLNYVIGKKRHFLEVGAGMTYLSGDSLWYDDETTSHTWLGWWNVNYRFNMPNRLSMRAGISGFVSSAWGYKLASRIPVPEWSLGYRF